MNITPTMHPSSVNNIDEFRHDVENSRIWSDAWSIRLGYLSDEASRFTAPGTDFSLRRLSPNTTGMFPNANVVIEKMRDPRSVKLVPALGPGGVCLVAQYDEDINVFSPCLGGYPTPQQAEAAPYFIYERTIYDHTEPGGVLDFLSFGNYWPMSRARQAGWVTNPEGMPFNFGELQFVKPIITFSDLTQFRQELEDFVSASGVNLSNFSIYGGPVTIGNRLKCGKKSDGEWKLFFEGQRGLSEVTIMSNSVLISGPSTGSYVSWRRPFEGEKDRGFKLLREHPYRSVDPLLEQHYVFGGNIVYAERNPQTGEYMPYVFCVNPITGYAMLGELKKGEDIRDLLEKY